VADTGAYKSPPGTYERIWKHLLEDPTLSDAECRGICYAAGKPPGWVFYPDVMARELDRSVGWAKRVLTELRKRGLVVTSPVLTERGTYKQRPSELRRDRIGPVQNHDAESARWLPLAETSHRRSSEPARRLTSAGESARLSDDVNPIATTDQGSESCPGVPGNVQVEQPQQTDPDSAPCGQHTVCGAELWRRSSGSRIYLWCMTCQREVDAAEVVSALYGRHKSCGEPLAQAESDGRLWCQKCRRWVSDQERTGSACPRHQRYGRRKGCQDCEAMP